VRCDLFFEKSTCLTQRPDARKTVTIDAHPHTGIPAVSIHPCRHAAVMKLMLANSPAEPRHFLLTFLRFAQTAIPSVQYDFTI
jgi:ubiquitin-like-conjugating enzyme ATG3